ncbi:MAG: hypothetical protein JOZ47_17915 [Kutzneria sp.]|nr:hypothetical protein [Acidobacteriaceae bacterium]MBV9846923.1 hypothetical protein [Kutzneria sp.]
MVAQHDLDVGMKADDDTRADFIDRGEQVHPAHRGSHVVDDLDGAVDAKAIGFCVKQTVALRQWLSLRAASWASTNCGNPSTHQWCRSLGDITVTEIKQRWHRSQPGRRSTRMT